MRICSETRCASTVMAKGWCSKHYYLLRDAPLCKVDECGRKACSKGYCRKHYARFVRHGDPLGGSTDRGARINWIFKNKDFAGDACIVWPFAIAESGYPACVSWNGGQTGAHRVMCEMRNGKPSTSDHQAAHSCGKGKNGCINPNHLRWATAKENHADSIIHGTHPGLIAKGERHGNAKLDEQAVIDVRRRATAGESQASIARDLQMSSSLISRLVNRKIWVHVN